MKLSDVKEMNLSYLERKRVELVMCRAASFCEGYFAIKQIFRSIERNETCVYHNAGFTEVSTSSTLLSDAALNIKSFVKKGHEFHHITAPLFIRGPGQWAVKHSMFIDLSRVK